jgi:hypothetical protein
MIQNIAYGSLFSQRRSYYKLPLVDLGAKRKPVPPAPVPVSMGPANLMSTLVGLVSGPRVLTGEDIDVICELRSIMETAGGDVLTALQSVWEGTST